MSDAQPVLHCGCGDPDPAGCMNANAGYDWCRPCGDHHRPPECAVDEQGRSLAPCGHPWEDTDVKGHYDWCDPDADDTSVTAAQWHEESQQ